MFAGTGRMSNPITAAMQTALALTTIPAKGTATPTQGQRDTTAVKSAAHQFIPNPVTNSQGLIPAMVIGKDSNLSNSDE